MKRRTPLQVLWKSARVWAYADGRIRVTPQWRDAKGRESSKHYAAQKLEELLERELRGGKERGK